MSDNDLWAGLQLKAAHALFQKCYSETVNLDRVKATWKGLIRQDFLRRCQALKWFIIFVVDSLWQIKKLPYPTALSFQENNTHMCAIRTGTQTSAQAGIKPIVIIYIYIYISIYMYMCIYIYNPWLKPTTTLSTTGLTGKCSSPPVR